MIVKRVNGVLMGYMTDGTQMMFLGETVVVCYDDQVVSLDRSELIDALYATAGIQVPQVDIPAPETEQDYGALDDASPDDWDRAARAAYKKLH